MLFISGKENQKLVKFLIVLISFVGIGGHADACHGDSGGPITMKNPVTKKHILLGIVSWGVDCGDPNHYGIYVKLSNFLSWVQLIVS